MPPGGPRALGTRSCCAKYRPARPRHGTTYRRAATATLFSTKFNRGFLLARKSQKESQENAKGKSNPQIRRSMELRRVERACSLADRSSDKTRQSRRSSQVAVLVDSVCPCRFGEFGQIASAVTLRGRRLCLDLSLTRSASEHACPAQPAPSIWRFDFPFTIFFLASKKPAVESV